MALLQVRELLDRHDVHGAHLLDPRADLFDLGLDGLEIGGLESLPRLLRGLRGRDPELLSAQVVEVLAIGLRTCARDLFGSGLLA